MRVLHILEATSGGTRRHVLDLLPGLQARGASCALIYSPLRNPSFVRDADFLGCKNIETHQVLMGHRWARRSDALALRALCAHLKKNRYDIIHCHSSNAGMLGRLANAFSGASTPLVYTPHYVAFAAGIPRAQRRAALYLEKILASQTSHFIAVSQHEYSLLRRVLKIEEARASVIHNGVNLARNTKPETRNAFVIGCFGRLTCQKNQGVLIRALPLVLKKIPAARLQLVGGGEDETLLRTLSKRLGCDDCIDFRGEVFDARGEYSNCDIIAQPSRWEGCSYAILEAMSSARAVVASRRGGNAEVIGNAGVLAPCGDEKIWAREIIALAQDEARRKNLGDAARARVEKYFRLETMIEKTLAVYQAARRSAKS